MDNSRPKYKKKNLIFWGEYKIFFCLGGIFLPMDAYNKHCHLQRFTACFYTETETSTAHSTVPYHNTIYAYLSHIQFLVRKTGCIWVLNFWLLVVPFLYHSVIPLNFATSCRVSFNNASAITAPILCIGVRRPAALCDHARYWSRHFIFF